jgi:hypothetical protein
MMKLVQCLGDVAERRGADVKYGKGGAEFVFVLGDDRYWVEITDLGEAAGLGQMEVGGSA